MTSDPCFVTDEIRKGLANQQGYRNALKQFAKAIENGQQPKRVWKPSGINKKGQRFDPYIRLSLHHHHLGRGADPIIVFQQIGSNFYAINVTSHAEFFNGNEMKWLAINQAAIDWQGCTDILQAASAIP
jgi:hypothetical protein